MARVKAATAEVKLAAGAVWARKVAARGLAAVVRVAAGLVAACLVTTVMVQGGVEVVTTVVGSSAPLTAEWC